MREKNQVVTTFLIFQYFFGNIQCISKEGRERAEKSNVEGKLCQRSSDLSLKRKGGKPNAEIKKCKQKCLAIYNRKHPRDGTSKVIQSSITSIKQEILCIIHASTEKNIYQHTCHIYLQSLRVFCYQLPRHPPHLHPYIYELQFKSKLIKTYFVQLFLSNSQILKQTMEIATKVQQTLKVDESGFICCSGKNYRRLFRNSQGLQTFGQIINGLGTLSAKAQNLVKFSGSQQRIYIKVEDNKALGFVRVGEKGLFYRDYLGNFKQIYPTCVLDIYVHESCQRAGIGKEVFQKFLQKENTQAKKLAYDKPSSKLIGFLKKHYNLSKHVPQGNNFIIFDAFFQSYSKPTNGGKKTPALEQIEIPEKKQNEPIDSLELLQRELQNLRSNKNIKQQKPSNLGFRTPWGLKEEHLLFRTTANTYGNYYLQK